MPEQSDYVVVVNEVAGSTDAAAVQEAVAVLRRHGAVELAQVGPGESLDPVIEGLEGRTLVVAGGDGTLHVAVAALHRLGELGDRPLGLIPLGTGNDVARGVGIPLDPTAAARLVAEGAARAMDLIDLHGEPVVNAVHFGLGVAAARAASRVKALGPVAYAIGGLVAGVTAEAPEATITLDGEVMADGPVSVGAVMSGFSVGGGTALCPPARPDDGALDVVVVPEAGRRARARFGLAMRRGAHLLRPGVCHATGEAVEVRSRQPIDVNVDGEIRSLPERWAATVRPGAWRLIRPA